MWGRVYQRRGRAQAANGAPAVAAGSGAQGAGQAHASG